VSVINPMLRTRKGKEEEGVSGHPRVKSLACSSRRQPFTKRKRGLSALGTFLSLFSHLIVGKKRGGKEGRAARPPNLAWLELDV